MLNKTLKRVADSLKESKPSIDPEVEEQDWDCGFYYDASHETWKDTIGCLCVDLNLNEEDKKLFLELCDFDG